MRSNIARLPTEPLPDALTLAREIQEQGDRAAALSAPASYLPVGQRFEILSEALAAASNIKDGRSVRVLRALASRLPDGLLLDALTVAREIQAPDERTEALGALARQLPTEEQKRGLSEVLIAACETEAFQRSRIPLDLAPDLPAELLSDALASIQKVEAGSSLIRTLGEFVPYLKDEPARQGVELLLHTIPHCEQGDALDAIAEFIPLLSDLEETFGLNEVQRAIRDTARWFP